MTAMSGARICLWCDQSIKANSVRIEHLFSMSGVRPDDYRHGDGDTDCLYQKKLMRRRRTRSS